MFRLEWKTTAEKYTNRNTTMMLLFKRSCWNLSSLKT